ncbi:MAG TPA: XRE family transcriptional regulator [Polyangiaceae bacterium]|nr:XRE family transcriptional regulator [Polyangiaceae bacterium]
MKPRRFLKGGSGRHLAKTTVPFEPARLSLARELRGLTLTELADRVGMVPVELSRFESGAARPEPAALARLSLALAVPIFFFARSARSARPEGARYFRRHAVEDERIGRQQLARVALLGDLLEFVDERVTLAKDALSSFSPAGHRPHAIEVCAQNVRRRWGLGMEPIADVTRVLEQNGILVQHLPHDADVLDAFSLRTGEFPVIFAAPSRKTAESVRFDKAHELGRLVMHQGSAPRDPQAEAQADRFAAAFLLPARAFASECPRSLDWDKLYRLEQRWRVAMPVLLERAFHLDCLAEPIYRRALSLWKDAGGPELETQELGWETPELLARAFELLREDWPFDRVADELSLTRVDLALVTAVSAP